MKRAEVIQKGLVRLQKEQKEGKKMKTLSHDHSIDTLNIVKVKEQPEVSILLKIHSQGRKTKLDLSCFCGQTYKEAFVVTVMTLKVSRARKLQSEDLNSRKKK